MFLLQHGVYLAFGKTKNRDAVNDPEVGCFCLAAHFGSGFLNRNMVDFGGSGSMKMPIHG